MIGVLIYGLINSSIFALMALGFCLTFGISGVANFAYGAFYVTGAYVTWQLVNSFGLAYPLAIVISIFTTGLLGAILYWLVVLRIRGAVLYEVIATFATGVGILELMRSVGLTGPAYKLHPFVDGSLEIFGVYVDFQRLIVIGVAVALGCLIWFFNHYTKMGLSFRGIAQDKYTALAFGIDSDRTAMFSLAIGSALAGIAGITILPLLLISVGEGTHILIFALAVGIVGGMESIFGLIVASIIFGYAQVIIATYFNPHFTMIVTLGTIILVLIIKPSGLFGKFKELEERI